MTVNDPYFCAYTFPEPVNSTSHSPTAFGGVNVNVNSPVCGFAVVGVDTVPSGDFARAATDDGFTADPEDVTVKLPVT